MERKGSRPAQDRLPAGTRLRVLSNYWGLGYSLVSHVRNLGESLGVIGIKKKKNFLLLNQLWVYLINKELLQGYYLVILQIGDA